MCCIGIGRKVIKGQSVTVYVIKMSSPTTAFVSVELKPLSKGVGSVVADISRVHILKVSGDQLKSEKIILNFFPLKPLEPLNLSRNDIDETGSTHKNIVFRSIELEQNLQQLRDLLSEFDLALCVNRLTAKFIKEATEDSIDTMVVSTSKT